MAVLIALTDTKGEESKPIWINADQIVTMQQVPSYLEDRVHTNIELTSGIKVQVDEEPEAVAAAARNAGGRIARFARGTPVVGTPPERSGTAQRAVRPAVPPTSYRVRLPDGAQKKPAPMSRL